MNVYKEGKGKRMQGYNFIVFTETLVSKHCDLLENSQAQCFLLKIIELVQLTVQLTKRGPTKPQASDLQFDEEISYKHVFNKGYFYKKCRYEKSNLDIDINGAFKFTK
jgi:hypothetical protein